jgi:hypothetical protein
MKKPKTDKLLKGIVGTSLALATLSGCGVNRHELTSIPDYSSGPIEVTETSELPSPGETDCDTWKWDEEAQGYQCYQEGSQRYGHYYHGGSWFPTMAAFIAGRATAGSGGSAGITNRNNSSTNQQVTQPRTNTNNNTSVTNSRSGMGSGGSYGG